MLYIGPMELYGRLYVILLRFICSCARYNKQDFYSLFQTDLDAKVVLKNEIRLFLMVSVTILKPRIY